MKAFLAWTAAFLLALVAGAPAADAGCLSGVRTGLLPPPPDLCFPQIPNPLAVPNPGDVDGDLFGDVCDGDYYQNCVWDFQDQLTFQNTTTHWSTSNPACDFNLDGSCGVSDWNIFRYRMYYIATHALD